MPVSVPAADHDLEMRVRAVPENVPVVRHALGGMAATRGADERVRGAIALAVTEAVANVVVHAYENDPGLLEVEVSAEGGELDVIVRDHGGGLRADSPGAGLGAGLRLIGSLAQRFDITRRDGTTEVHMAFRLAPEAPAA
jgi:serine/threonine-protein kinase RsbW